MANVNLSQADLGQMSVAAQMFQAAIEDCGTVRTELQANLERLHWGGQSAETFHKVMFEWDKRFTTVMQELGQMRDRLAANAQNHVKTQQLNLETTNSITKLLGG